MAVSSENGALTETSLANLLAVVEGVVVSPPWEQILDGISLRVTKELCGKLEIAFREEPIPLSGVGVDELMLTGTAFGLAGVRTIDGRELNWPGPVFTKLLAAWSDLVGLDIAKQSTHRQ